MRRGPDFANIPLASLLVAACEGDETLSEALRLAKAKPVAQSFFAGMLRAQPGPTRPNPDGGGGDGGMGDGGGGLQAGEGGAFHAGHGGNNAGGAAGQGDEVLGSLGGGPRASKRARNMSQEVRVEEDFPDCEEFMCPQCQAVFCRCDGVFY